MLSLLFGDVRPSPSGGSRIRYGSCAVCPAAPRLLAQLGLGNEPAGGFTSSVSLALNPLKRVVDLSECFRRIGRQCPHEFPIVAFVREVFGVKTGWFHRSRQLPEAIAHATPQVVAERE
jgi:hypothetical protein